MLFCVYIDDLLLASSEACDESVDCQIHFVVIISPPCPIYDVLCQQLVTSDSELIRFVIKHAVYYVRAQSPIGRNYALCYKRYWYKVKDELKFGLKSSCCNNEALAQMSATDYRHVSFALELIMLRAGIVYTPDCEWSQVQIDCMLTAIRTR